jgi:hypothetical protein
MRAVGYEPRFDRDLERGNVGDAYDIRGAGITNDEHAKLPIMSVAGVIDFIPTVFKYMRMFPIPVQGTVGTVPSTPTVGAPTIGATATGSGFLVGETYSYRVQAVNISGMSIPSASQTITIGAGDAGKPVTLAITNVAGIESYMVFRSAKESSASPVGKEMFVGQIVQSSSGTTTFTDNGKIVPGLDSVLFLPRDKNRAKLAVLGNLLNKMELAVKGTAFEKIYSSYCACVVERPRSFSVADSVFQQREGL